MKYTIRVQPGARVRKVAPWGEHGFKVYVTAPPEDGKANEEAREVLSEYLGVKKRQVTIARGHTARQKIVEVNED